MEWICAIIYIIGAILTHYIIYKYRKETNVEHQTANIVSFLWPLALIVFIVITIEHLFVEDVED